MSSETDKYLSKALKNVGIVEQQGSGNIGQFFAEAGKAITPHLDKIGKAAGDFFSKPENQKMVMEAGTAIATNAMNQKSKGQKTINRANRAKRNIKSKKMIGFPGIGQRIQVMAALGKIRVQIGTMRQDLLAKGVVSDMAAYETIRNALAEELYSKSFTNELQKATLISVIKDIDNSLNQGFVPNI